jgi:predicted lactoylglutathione lyase
MSQIAYVCIGTNDFEKAQSFYDALLADVGGKRVMPTPPGMLYSIGKGAMMMLCRPHDGNKATFGNGTMIAIQTDTKEQVASLHAKALALGGTCEGKPGPRGAFGDFSYVRDLDGNKLAFFAPNR